jgi:hypothetical protein
VLGAGAVHGLCVAAMLPMLITLPGPGSSAPPAIDVEVVQPSPILPKHLADPATTSAQPKVEAPPAEPASEPARPEVAKQATAQPPDDMPQQIASPVAPAPAGIDALTPEPLAPTLVTSPAFPPPPPEEVKQVTLEPDITTTSSIVPRATSFEVKNLRETPTEASVLPAPPISETPKPEPQPEVVRADPKEETPPQAVPADDAAEAETPAVPTPVAKPVAGKKPAPQAAPKADARAKAKSKPEPAAAKKSPVVTAKRSAPQTHRVVRGRPQTPMSQSIMSFFGSARKPPAGANASARRPVVQSQ